MIEMTNLLQEPEARAVDTTFAKDHSSDLGQRRNCDGCGDPRPDVDLWATDSDTGDELWLCEACAEW